MDIFIPLNPRFRLAYYGIISGLILLLYLFGAARQSREVNTDMSRTDQSAYMHYAKKMAETDYAYVGGRRGACNPIRLGAGETRYDQRLYGFC